MTETDWMRLKAHELRELAQRDAVVILPIAAVEQHGPHLPVMTDTRLGHEVAMRAAAIAYATRPTIVTPVVWSGLSEHHMPYGGTLLVSHATFRAILRDLVTVLIRNGFKDILISNSHGGNENAMRQIVDELSSELTATLVATTYPFEAGDAFNALLEDQPMIDHACEAETSMMLAVEPDLVDTSDLAGVATEMKPDLWQVGRAAYRFRSMTHGTANGVSGNPACATAEKGEKLLNVAAQALADLIVDPKTWEPDHDLRPA
ncbi:MAG: creatininase family protein [Pseudomonadota bacterium]